VLPLVAESAVREGREKERIASEVLGLVGLWRKYDLA
jgi:hypothetical protein